MHRAAKLIEASEAVALMRDHQTVALGGFAITRNVIAIVHEMIRAALRDLTLVQVVGGMDTDLLVGAGCVSHLLYSGGSLDRFGLLNAVNVAAQAGGLATEEYSSLSLTLRLHAAALGLPFVPVRSMLGSDLLASLVKTGSARVDTDPFGDGDVVLLPPLRPDVAVIHVDEADECGNASLAGPHWTIKETAHAAHHVIVLAERLVPVGSIPPERVLIPAAIVTGVVPMRYSAHPTAVVGQYDFDREHLHKYARLTKEGRAGIDAYLAEYVLGSDSHDEYLRRAGWNA